MTPVRSDPLASPVKWALAATLAATAASLLIPNDDLVGVRDGAAGGEARTPPALRPASAPTVSGIAEGGLAGLQALREAGAATAATSASFDPFVGVVPPAPPPPPAVAPVATAAPPPSPPPQDFRYLGRMTGPDGVEQTLLGRGDAAVPITVGTTLDNGYVVESIAADAVVLVYPPFGSKAVLQIPQN
jgi:hypothetical protein